MAPQELQTLINDDFLLSVLQTSTAARDRAVALFDLISSQNTSADAATVEEGSPEFAGRNKAQKELLATISHLRGLNRRIAHAVRSTKADTSASRNEVDTLHLNLQNLYYEQRHLIGEISACESYPHKYLELPLIPEDQFFARFPEKQNGGEEEIMRARIEEEHRERTELEEQRQGLLKRKQALMAENAKRKQELVNLDKDLEAFIDAAKPIQKTFEKEY